MRMLTNIALAALLSICSCGGESAQDASPEDPDEQVEDLTSSAARATIIVEPDDGADAITSAITGAKKSVHVEVYELTEAGTISALVAAHKAGLDVKVLLEKSPFGNAQINAKAFDTLSSAGVNVHWTAGLYAYTHAKFMLIDSAAVYVMTLNLTGSGLKSNRDFAIKDKVASDVAAAEAVFAADFAGKTPSVTKSNLVVSPVNSRAKLTALIDEAKSKIDIEVEELADSALTDRLIAALKRGVAVRVVVPAKSRPALMDAKLALLKASGAKVKTLASPSVHAKAIVVDGARLFTGSLNISATSMDKNRELGLISTSSKAISRVSTAFSSDFAAGTAF